MYIKKCSLTKKQVFKQIIKIKIKQKINNKKNNQKKKIITCQQKRKIFNMKLKVVVENNKDNLPPIMDKSNNQNKIKIVPDNKEVQNTQQEKQEKPEARIKNKNILQRKNKSKPNQGQNPNNNIEEARQKINDKTTKTGSVLYQQQLKNGQQYIKLKQKSTIQFFDEFFLQQQQKQFIDNKNDAKNIFYEENYGKLAYNDMLQEQLNLADTLGGSQCKVSQQLRSKMVDWMVEVFYNYNETTSEYTYYRAVEIMDYFIKHKSQVLKKKVQDADLHRIGVCCIFIASKIEDRLNISLDDIHEKVCHRKFSVQQIKATEWEILDTLNYDVMTPTPFEFYRYYMYGLFQDGDHQIIHKLYETGKMIMKIVLIDDCLRCFPQHIIALCGVQQSIILYIQQLFNDESYSQNQITEEKLNQGLSIIGQKLKSQLSEKEVFIFDSINEQLQESLAQPEAIIFQNVLKYQNQQNFLNLVATKA